MQKNAKTELLVFDCRTMMGRPQQGTRENISGEFLHRMSAPDFHGANLDLIWQKSMLRLGLWVSPTYCEGQTAMRYKENHQSLVSAEDTNRENRACHCAQL